MELKQSLSERLVRRIVANRRHVPDWTPFFCWLVPIVHVLLVIMMALVLDSRDVWSSIWTFTSGFSAAWFIGLGYVFWERQGWLHLVDAKESEISDLQKARDELQSRLDALAIDQASVSPDTRIRE